VPGCAHKNSTNGEKSRGLRFTAVFTEGFDTADLKDAKTLLDELAG
jgi:hypothetical protein